VPHLSQDGGPAHNQPGPVKSGKRIGELTRDRFSDVGWLYEHKSDGEQCLAQVAR
jgi:hypothetical protein